MGWGNKSGEEFQMRPSVVLLVIGVVTIGVGALTWKVSADVLGYYSVKLDPKTAKFNVRPTEDSGLIWDPKKADSASYLRTVMEPYRKAGRDAQNRGKMLVACGGIFTTYLLMFNSKRRRRRG